MPSEQEFAQLKSEVEALKKVLSDGSSLPPHFHKTDRIEFKDIIGGPRVVNAAPTFDGKEGREILYWDSVNSVARIYKYLGGAWRAFQRIEDADINDLSDVNITSVSDEDLITYDNATSKWVNIARSDVVSGNKINVSTSSVSITNTTTETSLYTVSVPANTLGSDNAIRAVIHVDTFDMKGSESLLLRIKYGGTTFGSASIANTSGSNMAGLTGTIEAMVLGNGATNSQKGTVKIHCEEDESGFSNANAHEYCFGSSPLGTASVDSTNSADLDITLKWNSASTLNKIICNAFVMYKID